MKESKSLLALALVVILAVTALSGCSNKIDTSEFESSTKTESSTQTENSTSTDSTEESSEEAPKLVYADGTVLRMATGYNSSKTGLFFDAEVAGEGITLADGNTYHAGDLKPTWVEVENVLHVVFEDKYQGNSSTKEFEYWKERLTDVDMLSGTASTLTE